MKELKFFFVLKFHFFVLELLLLFWNDFFSFNFIDPTFFLLLNPSLGYFDLFCYNLPFQIFDFISHLCNLLFHCITVGSFCTNVPNN
jgi:hypothetical protein